MIAYTAILKLPHVTMRHDIDDRDYSVEVLYMLLGFPRDMRSGEPKFYPLFHFDGVKLHCYNDPKVIITPMNLNFFFITGEDL